MNIKIKPATGFSPADLRGTTTDMPRMLEVRMTVESIAEAVRKGKDNAVAEFTLHYDKVSLNASAMRVSDAEIDQALEQVDRDVLAALETARSNIKAYHERQKPTEWTLETTPGIMTGLLARPLGTVGIYVPGGKAFYPSTVLMCAVPAFVAGVQRVVMVTPPKKDGTIEPIVLASARVAGITEIYKVGGAQAIAALAFGTETIPKVDAIVGPGNAYVSMAKKLLQGEVLIDSPAGPSEVLIIAGDDADPDLVAIDACAQAEHDEEAIAIVVCTTMEKAIRIKDSIERVVKTLQRKETITTSLERNGLIMYLGKGENEGGFAADAAGIINGIAPEHLHLNCSAKMVDEMVPLVYNAGAIFLGEMSPVALGDYASGTNHVLPTNGLATRYSALNTMHFIKVIPFTRASSEGAKNLGPTVSKIARFEGLEAHARSVDDRIKKGD